MRVTTALLLAGVFIPAALTRKIPDALQNFYNTVKDGNCPHTLHNHLRKNADSRDNFQYCSDDSEMLMWVAGPSSLADMDVDCDGANNAYGACANDPTGQSITAFQDQVARYGIEDLDANTHGYVVLGTGRFDPRDQGVRALSVVAVMCGENLFYGVWGDSNADDLVGEASVSMAQACYGSRMNGDAGHSDTDVLYLAFRTDEAVPGRNASWTATGFSAFEESLAAIGDAMLARYLPGGSNYDGGSSGGSGGSGGGKGGDGSGDDEDAGFVVQAPGICALLSLLGFVSLLLA